jgi:hypothetical protein
LCDPRKARYAAAFGLEMMIIVILLVIACLLPVVFFKIGHGRPSSRRSPHELATQLRPVDIDAFCNLVDPEEEQFLRSKLPLGLFRSVRRERLLAAAEYIGAVSHNAAILTQVGESVRHHADPNTAQAAQELANNAVRLRLHCSLVMLKLWAAIVLPGAGLSSSTLVDRYQHLSALARCLGRLPYSSDSSEVSATG